MPEGSRPARYAPFLNGKFLKALDKTEKRVYNIIIDALEIKSIKAKKHKSAKAVLFSKGHQGNEGNIKAHGLQT